MTPYELLTSRHRLILQELDAAVVAVKNQIEVENLRYKHELGKIQKACPHNNWMTGYAFDVCRDCGVVSY